MTSASFSLVRGSNAGRSQSWSSADDRQVLASTRQTNDSFSSGEVSRTNHRALMSDALNDSQLQEDWCFYCAM